jgi:hypothetical protein
VGLVHKKKQGSGPPPPTDIPTCVCDATHPEREVAILTQGPRVGGQARGGITNDGSRAVSTLCAPGIKERTEPTTMQEAGKERVCVCICVHVRVRVYVYVFVCVCVSS